MPKQIIFPSTQLLKLIHSVQSMFGIFESGFIYYITLQMSQTFLQCDNQYLGH